MRSSSEEINRKRRGDFLLGGIPAWCRILPVGSGMAALDAVSVGDPDQMRWSMTAVDDAFNDFANDAAWSTVTGHVGFLSSGTFYPDEIGKWAVAEPPPEKRMVGSVAGDLRRDALLIVSERLCELAESGASPWSRTAP